MWHKESFPLIVFLLLLLFFFGFGLWWFKVPVERELTAKTAAHIQRNLGANIEQADLVFDGRDGYLGGVVESEQVKKRAEAIGEDVQGVRFIKNRLRVRKAAQQPAKVVEKIVYRDRPAAAVSQNQKFLATNAIFFDTSIDKTHRRDKVRVDAVYGYLKQNPNLKVNIVGYADKRGNEEFNRSLSLRRAQGVMSQLTRRGINADRMKIEARGETRLENLPFSRRVEFEELN
jgi:outer membrane protein OmpA-like peptidoglycan-associated protein